jgi:hypothetical protein
MLTGRPAKTTDTKRRMSWDGAVLQLLSLVIMEAQQSINGHAVLRMKCMT